MTLRTHAGRLVPALLPLAALLAVSPTRPALADAPPSAKMDNFLGRTLATHPQTGWTTAILQMRGDLSPDRRAQLARLGADVTRNLPFIGAAAVRVPSRNLTKLAALPFVSHLSADARVVKNDEFTVASSGADTAFSQYSLTGSGVTVAVVDSGVNPVADLDGDAVPTTFLGITTGYTTPSRVLASANFVADTTKTRDDCGHGTHVAGIIGGNGAASTGPQFFRTFYGIARKSNIVNVRVLNEYGQGDVSTVLSGIQWVINNQKTYKIRVLNLSLGHPVGESYTTDPLCQAVEAAWKAGIVVVCAAGNEGRIQNVGDSTLDNEGYGTAYGSIQSPGNDPYVITVGAMKSMDGVRAHDKIATYSSRGPSRLDLILKPDIIAPGNRVISLDARDCFLENAYGVSNTIPLSSYANTSKTTDSRRYFRLSGTSMAAPVVAGAAALLLQASPKLSPDTVKARLMMSADKWAFPDGSGDPCTFGAGYLNIPAALNTTVVARQYAMSPTLSQDDLGNVFIVVDGTLWGTRAVWGTDVTDLRAVWGARAVWGTDFNLLSSSRAVWGKSVWADRAVWGKNMTVDDLSWETIYGE